MKSSELRDLETAAQFLVSKEVLYCQTALVEELLKHEILNYDEIENLYEKKTDEPKEVFEWWLICDRLARNLRENHEPILECDYGTWWGRTCTGQAICMDPIIRKIAKHYFM